MSAMPMTVPPTPMTVMPVMAPPDLFGLEPIDLVPCRHGRADIRIHAGPFVCVESLRRQRRSLHARGQRSGACGKSDRKFQKVPTFHGVFLFHST
jgi:hypothetical protein